MNIIRERDKQNLYRKKMKEQYDKIMHLSVQTQDWRPLLQEGMVTYTNGKPWFYIMKNSLRRYMDELQPDYEGTINVGHTDMASFPDRIVGRWTKDNMRLVDVGNGRQRLETNLPLNHEHPIVKALEQSEFDLGLSVEMSMNINEELTNNTELNPFGVPVVDGLFVYDYAIVGNAGDVNSMGIHLKGGTELQMNEIAKLLKKEGGSNIAELSKILDKALLEAEDAPASEETTEETVEETTEELDATESEEETAEEEAAEESAEETTEETAEEEEGEEAPATDETFMAVMNQLAEEIKALREENADLKAQLKAKNDAEAEFVNKFKKLSVSLGAAPKAQPAAEHKKVYTDGIGE